jgi:hypothetical protein
MVETFVCQKMNCYTSYKQTNHISWEHPKILMDLENAIHERMVIYFPHSHESLPKKVFVHRYLAVFHVKERNS